MKDYYLSSKRLEELKKELEDLKKTGRRNVSERLKRAKELGDLSENSEYQEARREQEEVEMKISELEVVVKNAKLLPETHSKDIIEIGSTLEIEKGGNQKTVMIVGSREAKPEEGRISNESPLGSALLGKKKGESVTVEAPGGKMVYTVVGIK